jgi:hypothetical protein
MGMIPAAVGAAAPPLLGSGIPPLSGLDHDETKKVKSLSDSLGIARQVGFSMRRATATLIFSALTFTILAGCIGGDGVEGAMPSAVVTVEEVPGQTDTYRFDASRSGGKNLVYEWSFGDGEVGEGPVVVHTYTHGSGRYEARLLISDPLGRQAVWTETVVVGTGMNLPPDALFSLPKRIFGVGEPVRVDASRTTDTEGDPIEFRWDFNYLMSMQEYEADVEALGDGKSAQALPLPRLSDVRDILGSKHAGHGGEDGPGDYVASLFVHTATTKEPVYILEEGFPEETVFFIRLRAYDVKGAHVAIISEEIWPVLVDNNPPARVVTGSETGRFDIGGDSAVTDALGNLPEGTLSYEAGFTFTTEFPAEAAFVNVTFNENPLAENGVTELQNVMRIDARPPNFADPWTDTKSGGRISLTFNGADDPGVGEWDVYLVARKGFDIEWTVEWWVQVDINPFRGIELPYL